MLLKIKLCVKTGEFVSDAHILPLSPLPEVVCWGARFFTLDESTVGESRTPEYREALVGWCLPETYANEPA